MRLGLLTKNGSTTVRDAISHKVMQIAARTSRPEKTLSWARLSKFIAASHSKWHFLVQNCASCAPAFRAHARFCHKDPERMDCRACERCPVDAGYRRYQRAQYVLAARS